MKITKLMLFLLTLSLVLTGLMACSKEPGACDMDKIKDEINSMKVEDFEETASVTEYVKFTVKDHGEFVIRLRSDIAPITVENFQSLVQAKFYQLQLVAQLDPP